MADGVADGYLPGSIKEAVKYGISGLAMLWLARKFAPKQSYQFGLQELPPKVVVTADATGMPILSVTK